MSDPRTSGAGDLIDGAAERLRESCNAFTRRHLFYALRQLASGLGEAIEIDFAGFVDGPLSARLRRGPIHGLLPPSAPKLGRHRLPPEYDAYFPAAILMVEKASLVDFFAASGVLVQARIAVVALEGYPLAVTRWLCRGLREGHRAPVGYVHDSAAVAYPFLLEPLRTYLSVAAKGQLLYRDLGLPPRGAGAHTLGLQAPCDPVRELEELPPHILISFATRALLAMTPRDEMLMPSARTPIGGRLTFAPRRIP